MVVLSKKRSLDITIGDGLAHFTIRRSRNKKGQRFLGFYIKDQEIFSPQTHGMIGEGVCMTVCVWGSTCVICCLLWSPRIVSWLKKLSTNYFTYTYLVFKNRGCKIINSRTERGKMKMHHPILMQFKTAPWNISKRLLSYTLWSYTPHTDYPLPLPSQASSSLSEWGGCCQVNHQTFRLVLRMCLRGGSHLTLSGDLGFMSYSSIVPPWAASFSVNTHTYMTWHTSPPQGDAGDGATRPPEDVAGIGCHGQPLLPDGPNEGQVHTGPRQGHGRGVGRPAPRLPYSLPPVLRS